MLPGVKKTSSAASNDLFAFTGIALPAFVFGPGSKDAIHRPDEYVEIAHLESCTAVVHAFLREWAATAAR
ncbi:acetylornithine deacetylase [compost metagenome]